MVREGQALKGLAAGCALGVFLAARAGAQVSNFLPAEYAPDERPLMLDTGIVNPAEEAKGPAAPQSQPYEGGLVHPWELPPVQVVGNRPGLREEQLVGTYGQPVWTADRRFTETRVYVRPEGSLQFEFWLIPTVNRHGPSEIQTQYELEVGLPHRFQLDLYLINRSEGSGGPTFTDYAIELRYALADWGKIWGNPTAYIEYTKQDQGPDVLESKLLLGDTLAPRWHWGANLTFEHDFGGDFANTYELTAGLSYAVIDNVFDVGAELKYQEFDTHGHRGEFTDNTFIGPSLQYRPLPRMHVDLSPLVGITHESPALQLYFVLGWEF